MKKLHYFYAIATLALFGACTAEEGLQEYTMDETRGSVKTEFTISFPSKVVGTTRMASGIVQAGGSNDFRGISSIELYPFSSKKDAIIAGAASTDIPTPISLKGATSTTISAVTMLNPSGSDANDIASTSNLFADNNAHLYQDVEVEIGTKAFMFYGVATASSGGNRFTDGSLTKTTSGTKLSDITFNLYPIYAGNMGENYDDIENYLTSIATSTGWSNSENVILKTLYDNFISMKAGSWASVQAAVQQLYKSLQNKTFAATADNTVKGVILDRIKSTPGSDSNNDGILEFATLGDFPADISLPDGAVYISWNSSTSQFKMITFPEYDGGTVLADGTSLVGYYTYDGASTYTLCTSGTADGSTTYYKKNTDNTGLNITNLSHYAYPAELYYRTLSNIRTANDSKLKYYNTGTDHKTSWEAIITQYGAEVVGTNDEVKNTTRSIAIVDQVQYAVARFDATVTATADALADAVADNIPITRLSDPDDLSSTRLNCFPVTGILIGNQRVVDYKFEPVTTGSPTLYTIYDKTIDPSLVYLQNVNPASLGDAAKTHTLVLETPEVPVSSPTQDQMDAAKVKIAVEFENNSGTLFVGWGGNIIYPGTKFYLVGEFDPLDTSNQANNPNSLRQVFKQDHTTTANLVVSGLSNAYNTVPDLRAPQLELGLSVDLSWQSGITQTINLQ